MCESCDYSLALFMKVAIHFCQFAHATICPLNCISFLEPSYNNIKSSNKTYLQPKISILTKLHCQQQQARTHLSRLKYQIYSLDNSCTRLSCQVFSDAHVLFHTRTMPVTQVKETQECEHKTMGADSKNSNGGFDTHFQNTVTKCFVFYPMAHYCEDISSL